MRFPLLRIEVYTFSGYDFFQFPTFPWTNTKNCSMITL